jgi:hypothetical protein
MVVKCPYCRRSLKSTYGLEQHIKSTPYCQNMREAFRKIDNGESPDRKKARCSSPRKEDVVMGAARQLLADLKLRAFGQNTAASGKEDETMRDDLAQEDEEEDHPPAILEGEEEEEDEHLFDPYADPSSSEATSSDEEADTELHQNQAQMEPVNVQRAGIMGKRFKQYVRHSHQHNVDFNEVESDAVKLMHMLIKKKATLDTYAAVMDWHLRASGKIQPHESAGQSKLYISREKLMKKLKTRYNMDKKYAVPHPITLPHTKTKVTIWKKFARDNVMSLLTDPRWKDSDWLYFDEDPFAVPPRNCPFLEDLNTGEAFLATHRQLITKPNQILVAIPLYIDGAVTGQYDKLQVTALKMTLGILNRRARDREYAWRTLGYVPNYSKSNSRGKKMLVESGHVAASEMYVDGLSDDEEGADGTVEDEVDKAADYHAILAVLLESLFALIAEGMIVDIYYKKRLYKDCELVFFVPFVKCDGDEADKLCCSYRSRTKGVKQLCRYCQCPCELTDDPLADFPMKTEPMLKRLFEAKKAEKLKDLSQIGIKNAFHGLRFGLHNDRGIHGACPWELLHAILLGIFKYTRDCFFSQMGASSATAAEINALAEILGALFARQSDRNKPRTKFGNGIMKGKLMAKEFTGVLLIIAAILRCEKGQSILRSARKRNFKKNWLIKDWILLVETLLQWESYLTLAVHQKKHVRRLKTKHRFLMFLLKKVGNRVKGMGFKVMKFHAILHLAFDILMFGVPMNVDTGSNESHHKTTKVAAKLTQKDIKSFEKQTSNRCDDFHVLDLAMEEIHGRPLWDYFNGYLHNEKVEKELGITTGGMKMVVSEIVYSDKDEDEAQDGKDEDDEDDDEAQDGEDEDEEDMGEETESEEDEAQVGEDEDEEDMDEEAESEEDEAEVGEDENAEDGAPAQPRKDRPTVEYEILTRMKNKEDVRVEFELLEFVLQVQKDLAQWIQVLPIYAEHSRFGQIFRSHPNYLGKGPWRDWVMVLWEEGERPAKIWGYLDLSAIPEGTQVSMTESITAGTKTVEKGVYAIVESGCWIHEDMEEVVEGEEPRGPDPNLITSELFAEFILETAKIKEDGEVEARMFFLVDVECFVRPMVVIPNIGSLPKCKFFDMAPKNTWAEMFEDWLDMDHKFDSMEMAPTEEEGEEESVDAMESSSTGS